MYNPAQDLQFTYRDPGSQCVRLRPTQGAVRWTCLVTPSGTKRETHPIADTATQPSHRRTSVARRVDVSWPPTNPLRARLMLTSMCWPGPSQSESTSRFPSTSRLRRGQSAIRWTDCRRNHQPATTRNQSCPRLPGTPRTSRINHLRQGLRCPSLAKETVPFQMSRNSRHRTNRDIAW